MAHKTATTLAMKGRLADALVELLAEKPFAKISIGEMAERAGVNRSTFYRNFDGKGQVVEFYIERIMRDWMADYQKQPDHSAYNYLFTIYDALYAKKRELLLLYDNDVAYYFLPVLNRMFAEHLDKGDPNVLELYRRYLAVGGIYNFIMLWLERGMAEPPHQVAAIGVLCYPDNEMPKYLD